MTRTRTTTLAALLALGLLPTAGCKPIQVALGTRTRLDRQPLASLSAALDQPAVLPGGKARLIVTATTPDGARLVTEGAGQGKVLWDSYRLEAVGASVSAPGELTLPKDPRELAAHPPRVRITAPGHPDLVADVAVPVRYDGRFRFEASGLPGSAGFDGRDGSAGASGLPGSIDAQSPSPGGNGGNGEDGGHGSDGSDGGPGHEVQVRMTLQAGAHPLVQVLAEDRTAGRKQWFLLDPAGGTLRLAADGGSGGSGGRGGRGGRGGSRGAGSPPGASGRDGADGRPGWPGGRGPGGHVTVTVDPQARPYLGVLDVSVQGGRKGAVDIVEAPVPPLW